MSIKDCTIKDPNDLEQKKEEVKNKINLATDKDNLFSQCIKEQKLKDDFKDRLQDHNPTIVINCCTNGENKLENKKKVQNIIDEALPNAIKLIGSHPSSSFFAGGFVSRPYFKTFLENEREATQNEKNE